MKRKRQSPERDYGRIGMGIDAFGGAVIDPTENVKALAESNAVHQDKIRDITQQLNEAKINHQKEVGELRERFMGLLRDAESARLNSIRQVDREDVNKMSATASTTAEALRAQVATTAQTLAASLSNAMGEVNKRLSAVELAQSEGKGKQQVVDPALTEAFREVRALAIRSNTAQGSGEGATKMWGYVVAAIGLILMIGMAMVTLGGVLVAIAYAVKK